jgi:glycosyltransferase involved in cell wall biosynthesis
LAILVYTTQIRFPGGFENLAVSLAETLANRGTPVFLLSHYSAHFAIPGDSSTPRELPTNVSVHHLDVPTKPSLLDLVRAAHRLRRLIRDLKVTAIEVSGFAPSLLASFATIGTAVRVAVGVHAIAPPPSCRSGRYWLWQLLRSIGSRVQFYGVSQSATEAWRKYIGCSGDGTATVFNCVSGSFFEPVPNRSGLLSRELRCHRDERIVLCVGRLLVSKGQILVARAVLPLLVQHNLRLVFAGRADTEPGDDGTQIRRLISEVDAGPHRERVHFLGARADVAAIMADAFILVHTPFTEAFGLVIAEAMAIGLPVIASDVDGIPEVTAGTECVLIPPGNPAALTAAVEASLKWSASERQRRITLGRERAKAFHPDRRAEQILTLLQPTRRGG